MDTVCLIIFCFGWVQLCFDVVVSLKLYGTPSDCIALLNNYLLEVLSVEPYYRAETTFQVLRNAKLCAGRGVGSAGSNHE